jgi:hypothetical protein
MAGLAVLTPVMASASGHEISTDAWLDAVKVAGVPSEVLFAVSLQESGTTFGGKRKYRPWPWVLNISNAGAFYATREEAEKALNEELSKGNRNVAVGLFQIHLRFNGHRVADPRSLLDPTTNLRIAAEVMKDCGTTYPSLPDQIACYYSGDPDEAGQWYAGRVLKLADRFGSAFVFPGLSLTPPRRPLRVPGLERPAADPEFVAFLARLGRPAPQPEARVISVAARIPPEGEQR